MRIAGYAISASVLFFVSACATTTEAPIAHTDEAPAHANESFNNEATPAEAAAAPAQDDELAAQRARMELRLHETELAMERARRFMENGDLTSALASAQKARIHSPENLEAKRLEAEIRGLIDPADAGAVAGTHDDLEDMWRVKVDKIKADVGESVSRAKRMQARGDYDEAIRELVLAQTAINSAQYAVDWAGLDTEVESQLESAVVQRDANLEAEELANQQAAHEALQERRSMENSRREAITASMLTEAIDHFNMGNYDAAQEHANRALGRDPRNAQAEELRQASFRAGREKVRADYIEAKREEFARWREHLDELSVPWTDVMTLPTMEHWRRITQTRGKRRGYDLSLDRSEGELALRAQLTSTGVQLPGIEDEESLRAVIDRVHAYTGLPLIVDQVAEDLVYEEGTVFQLDLTAEVSVRHALDLITNQAGEEVTWTIRHDAVFITSTEKAQGEPVVKNHDVQDLIMGITDFTGPRIDRLRLLDELEDDDGGGPFGGILDEAKRLIEIEDLATLIQENVAVDSWDADGVTIEPGEGFILVTHSPEVQAQVREFLEDLRRFNSSLVTIESRFMTIGNNWIQQIGNDLRGLDSVDVSDATNGLEDMASRGLDNGGAGASGEGAAGPPSAGFFYDDGQDGDFRATAQNFFANPLGESVSAIGGLTFQLTFLNDLDVSLVLRAVEKTEQYELVNSQILSVNNTQRAYVTVINQQAYIQDFDVEVAQFQAVADPQINVLHEGVVLDVRPTIHHDRKYLTLEVQPTVAKIVGLRTFSTTLGGNTSSVDFQLPELEVQSVNTSAIIPDGGSILLGGLSSVRNIERRAEVPWIARIPLLGFLFKEEGYNEERESLMILIKASINDVRELVGEKLERRY